VRKLILVSSGPFEEKYAGQTKKNRMGRLSRRERLEVQNLRRNLEDPGAFARFGEILSGADFYDPLPFQSEEVELRPDLYRKVWPQALRLRKSGGLLREAEKVRCPVAAIHGDHDPHPADGVREPLSRVLENFRFRLLEKCGHTPWLEKQAREAFFGILAEELEGDRA
jgi:pimeloyl-ACP methyl ester carboxylesterase